LAHLLEWLFKLATLSSKITASPKTKSQLKRGEMPDVSIYCALPADRIHLDAIGAVHGTGVVIQTLAYDLTQTLELMKLVFDVRGLTYVYLHQATTACICEFTTHRSNLRFGYFKYHPGGTLCLYQIQEGELVKVWGPK
jgi:hypothetical protein